MEITLDLSFYWKCAGAVLVVLAGSWSFRRVKGSVFGR